MAGRKICCSLLMVLLMPFLGTGMVASQEDLGHEAKRLQEEALKLDASGQYQEGIGIAKRALTLQERALGTEHLDVAGSLQILGRLYLRAGHYDSALSTYERALALREKALGSEHPDTARLVVRLADVHVRTSSYSKAEPLYQRALTIFERVLGAEHIDTSQALVGLADVYSEMGAYDRAEPLYDRALAIRMRISGAESVETARVLNNLGIMYFNMGSYARAKIMHQRALAIHEKVLGPEHPNTSMGLANLALVNTDMGAYVEAEVMFKRVLEIHERTVGAEHPYTTRILTFLAGTYMNVGAYNKAESLFRRAISTHEKTQGAGSADLAESLHGLAAMYSRMGLYASAEPLSRRALTIAEKSLGVEHPFTSQVTANLGDVYRQMGAYDRAEPLLRRAITVTEATRGPEHQNTAAFIHSLANLYSDTGAHLKAQSLYQRAVTIYENALGADHHETVRALRSLATTNWARGETQQALSLLLKAQRIQAKNSERFLVAGSETRKRDYLQTLTEDAFRDVSFAMSTPESAATVLGMTSVLQYKGRVLDSVLDSLARIRRSTTPVDHALLEQLADVADQLSTLTFGQGGNFSPEQLRARFAQLAAQQEQLEADLASRSQVFSREVTPVTLANIKRAIPVNAALVEWFRYMPFDPKKSVKARRGLPRYVAFVLKRSAEPVAVDIGQAQAVEALARRLRVALANPGSNDVKQHSAALSDQLLAPLRVHLQGVEHILFSPDGELNLVPMAALLDESGTYLAERFEVSYLTSGRDLLRIADGSVARAEAVVMADPDYGKRSFAASRTTQFTQPQRSVDLDRSGLMFRSLPGTALEARDLKTLLKLDAANVLLQLDATEAKLKSLKGPRILHVASHGFFLSDRQLTDEMSKRRGSGAGATPLPPSENPLLRSGIALAGANQRSSGDDDGILTALETTQLDLHGTALVVLSACDSGVGEVQNGEGVYGLRRALTLAGAQTQITSLWKVADDATRRLMVDYYRRLLQGEGRAAGLRSTQRAMLASTAYSHPYYWASFIPIGNWSALPAGQ